MADAARERTLHAFEAVRRRVVLGAIFVVLAHAALGAVFGMLLARTDETGAVTRAALALLGAIASALWAIGRLPEPAPGRLIEQHFPQCRNVIVTAEEVLAGSIESSAGATDRIFTRAADMLARIDAPRAAMAGRRIAVSLAVIAASAVAIVFLWRA
jgi:hypothetical protein